MHFAVTFPLAACNVVLKLGRGFVDPTRARIKTPDTLYVWYRKKRKKEKCMQSNGMQIRVLHLKYAFLCLFHGLHSTGTRCNAIVDNINIDNIDNLDVDSIGDTVYQQRHNYATEISRLAAQ